jgi:hypothetical protein
VFPLFWVWGPLFCVSPFLSLGSTY